MRTSLLITILAMITTTAVTCSPLIGDTHKYGSNQNGIHHHDPPNMNQHLQMNTRKLNHNNSGKKDYRKIVEYIIEDALQTLAEHYIEDYLIDFHVGDGHDEESPIYEWLPQDILKSILEHYIIEPGVKYAIHFTDNDE